MTWPGTQSSVQQSQAREIARQTSQTGPSLICFIMFSSYLLINNHWYSNDFELIPADENSSMNPRRLHSSLWSFWIPVPFATGERRWSDSQVWPGLDARCQVPVTNSALGPFFWLFLSPNTLYLGQVNLGIENQLLSDETRILSVSLGTELYTSESSEELL